MAKWKSVDLTAAHVISHYYKQAGFRRVTGLATALVGVKPEVQIIARNI
jgi:hypothetical protein